MDEHIDDKKMRRLLDEQVEKQRQERAEYNRKYKNSIVNVDGTPTSLAVLNGFPHLAHNDFMEVGTNVEVNGVKRDNVVFADEQERYVVCHEVLSNHRPRYFVMYGVDVKIIRPERKEAETEISEKVEAPLIWPEELTEPLAQALGFMAMQTGQIAHIFQDYGYKIERKIISEQAYVLHWLSTLALKHGEKFLDIGQETLREMCAELNEMHKAHNEAVSKLEPGIISDAEHKPKWKYVGLWYVCETCNYVPKDIAEVLGSKLRAHLPPLPSGEGAANSEESEA